ncbi:MAG: hypothetical protein HY909_19920 [Deltaproteobacteria bacterium]|nr:hypothetical protein [Deltaproteobacteria bacterium]
MPRPTHLALASLLALGCAIPDEDVVLDAASDSAEVAAPPDSAPAQDLAADSTPDLVMDNPVDTAPEMAPLDSAAPDTVTAPDVPPADSAPRDTPPPMDTRPPCTPTRTMCNMALECGMIPNGCPGGVFPCGVCSGGETWCATGTSRWQTRVYNCTQQAQREHAEWFDPMLFRDTSSWLVLTAQANAYVAFVARCGDGRGAVSIVDTNAPGNEVRVRGTDDAVAENFIVRTYGTGRTAGRYTSGCTPPGF